jgi:peptidoglycan/xylan/chitin deacetylase (PgdA/CDA1 family)
MGAAYKSIITIVLVSLLVSLMSISIVKAQGEPYTFTETWNYDGVHPEVDTGNAWEFTDSSGVGYYQPFSTTNQVLYADRCWEWHVSGGFYGIRTTDWGPFAPPGDYGTASYTFLQSSGNISVNATAHTHKATQDEPIVFPHSNLATFQHTLELLGSCGLYGSKVKIKLENASAGISGTPPLAGGFGGAAGVLLGMRCTFCIKTLISRNPDTYSVEFKYNDIGLATTKNLHTGMWWLYNFPNFASGEYGLVDLWNYIYGCNYSTTPPTEIGQKYVSNVSVGRIYIWTWTSIWLDGFDLAQDSSCSIGMNIGKITIEELHAPVVSTLPGTDVTKTSATLKGSITDDGGEPCQYRFRYKEEKGDYIYTSWAGSVTSGQSFSEAISDLKHNRTYYFNAQARNSAGESDWGNEQVFVTHPGQEFMITFDDGPYSVSTGYILDQLKNITKFDGTPVKAGFFLIGEDKSRAGLGDRWQCNFWGMCPDPGVMSNHDIVRRIAEERHLIGIHTQHHPDDLGELEPIDVEWEIRACYIAILDAGVTPMKVFRSPGLNDPEILPAGLEGWRIIRGELTDDWLPEPWGSEKNVIKKCRKVIKKSTDESPVILIFHDFHGRPGCEFDFRRIIMDELVEKDGFVLVDFKY